MVIYTTNPFLNRENLLLAIVIYTTNPFLNRENLLLAIVIYTTNPFFNRENLRLAMVMHGNINPEICDASFSSSFPLGV